MGTHNIMRVLIAGLLVAALFAAIQADELKDLSSADVAPAVASGEVEAAAEEDGEDLGEGTGSFSGALMTSGSFTMMASGGFEEEELGEGEGTGSFSGALMTSGSFTMMASGGF